MAAGGSATAEPLKALQTLRILAALNMSLQMMSVGSCHPERPNQFGWPNQLEKHTSRHKCWYSTYVCQLYLIRRSRACWNAATATVAAPACRRGPWGPLFVSSWPSEAVSDPLQRLEGVTLRLPAWLVSWYHWHGIKLYITWVTGVVNDGPGSLQLLYTLS